MKKIVSLVAIAALAGCSGAEEAETEVAAEETAAVAEAPVANPDAPAAGDYVVVYEDGTEQAFTMNADGTWSGAAADGSPASGTYTQQDGKTCFVTDPPSEEDSCWTNQPYQADGSWTSTSDNGVTVTVRPAASAG